MLPATVREAAERFGDRPAWVAAGDWALSYVDVDRVSDEVAAGLRRRGLSAGDVLALALPSGPEYLLAYLAAAKLGAVTAGVNTRLTPDERAAVLERAHATLVLSHPDTASGRSHEIAVPRAERLDDVLARLRSPGAEPPPDLPPDPDRPVAIVFTSGTTGTPKGALYRNRQLAAITAADVGDGWGGGGPTYIGTPFAHLGFMSKLPGSLRRGGTQYLLEHWRAGDALALIERHRMHTVGGVPAQLALMLHHPDFDAFDLSSVEYVISGGGPVTPGLAEEVRRRFRASFATRYSCTESGIGLGTEFDDPEDDAVVSVGRPRPGVELLLADERGAPVPDGEVGEVCLRSEAVMSEYWHDPEATAAAFLPSGHVRTGDLGRLDEHGRVRLVGRTKEMYVRGGYNVYPAEVEAVLSTHPAVAEVAIAPRPDHVMGEIGVAVVVPRERDAPPRLGELQAYVSHSLAAFKRPEDLVVTDELPLTAMEKVDRAVLAELVGEPPPGER